MTTEAAWSLDGSAVAYVNSYGPLLYLDEGAQARELVDMRVLTIHWAPNQRDLLIFTAGNVPRSC